MAGTSWRDGQYSIVEGKAYALLEALRAIQLLGLTQVVFETDSKSVVDAIHHIHGGASKFSSIICNINNILLSNPNFKVNNISYTC
jgi:ribonuclease HI